MARKCRLVQSTARREGRAIGVMRCISGPSGIDHFSSGLW
jgi:hypothetical protein